jgi:branched-chain amino acid transport system permease protein
VPGLNPYLFKLLAFTVAGVLAAGGGIVYGYASQSLTRVAGSTAVAGLPGVLRGPLEQSLFLPGAAFVLVVFFIPGGLTGRFTAKTAKGTKEAG